MSGRAHPPHDFADGDDCLAADSFAPHAEVSGLAGAVHERRDPPPSAPDETTSGEALEAHDPSDESTDAEHCGPDAAVAEEALLVAALESPATDAPFDEEAVEALRLDQADAEADSETWADDSLVADFEAVAMETDEAHAAEAWDAAPLGFARNEFLRGGDCALPELRVLPPPLALDPHERPVPDAAPERTSRRKRLRAWTCAGLAVVAAEVALSFWNAPPPEILVRDVAAERGIHPDDFVRIAEIESRLDPKAYNRLSKAAGLFQLLPGTAKQYKVADSFDARANAEAAARLLKHNAARLKKALGREPTAWELYLAHQQGAGGAIKLLKNPDKKAIEVVGRLPVIWNRGTEEMTAKQFATMWRDAFNGKKPAAVVN